MYGLGVTLAVVVYNTLSKQSALPSFEGNTYVTDIC